MSSADDRTSPSAAPSNTDDFLFEVNSEIAEIVLRVLAIVERRIEGVIKANPAIDEDCLLRISDGILEMILVSLGMPQENTDIPTTDPRYFCHDYWTR